MSNINTKYQSFDDLFNSILRGNEIEFNYGGSLYFLLPYYNNSRVVGATIGVQGETQEHICKSKQELFDFQINDLPFGQIFKLIDIIWSNF